MTDHPETARLQEELDRLREEYRTVSSLAMRLSRELDPSALLSAIVTEARRFTRSEAGTLYVRSGQRLAFAIAQNDALDRDHDGKIDELPRFELPIDGNSLAGLAALEKRSLNIDDARNHPSFSRRSSESFRYDVRSMLVVPLVEPDGEVLGVLQLMNGRDPSGEIVPFAARSADLTEVFASHAATALTIAGLYAELEEVFDSLVNYTAAAIDARDPATAGHSSRVAAYSVRIAKQLGDFTEPQLRELRFAGIFHDVGKIGVRECVLTKSPKITDEVMDAIAHRFAAAREAELARGWRVACGDPAHPALRRAKERIAQLAGDVEFVRMLSVPAWVTDEDLARLESLGMARWTDCDGNDRRLIEDDEIEKLSVRRGNLTEAERKEIQSHVQLSWEFLRKLPFPHDLARVPEIAWSHHERMDGSGYPRGISGDQIIPQARVLTVADVFDALTAEDRPYRKSMTPEKALAVIEHEAKAGLYDLRVVEALRTLVAEGHLVPRKGHATDDQQFDAAKEAWT